jgi:hypothetical protein
MKRRILYLVAFLACAVALAGVVMQARSVEIPAPMAAATVSVEIDAAKLKRNKTYTAQIKVDLTGVTAPGTNQPAAIGCYVIPIIFDRSALEFVSVSGGESAPFASGPITATNPAAANAVGMVAVVGSQTSSDSTTGTQAIAGVTFKVIATDSGRTSISIGPELAAPGLSLASPSSGASAAYRIAAVGKTTSFKIK